MTDPGLTVHWEGKTLLLRVPLNVLGNPEKIIGTAWSRAAEDLFDWRAWRVLDLGKAL